MNLYVWLGQDLNNKSCAYVTMLSFQQLFWNSINLIFDDVFDMITGSDDLICIIQI